MFETTNQIKIPWTHLRASQVSPSLEVLRLQHSATVAARTRNMAKRRSRQLATFWNGDTAETEGSFQQIDHWGWPHYQWKKMEKGHLEKWNFPHNRGTPNHSCLWSIFVLKKPWLGEFPILYWFCQLLKLLRPSLSFRTGKFWKIKVPSSSPIVWGQGQKCQTWWLSLVALQQIFAEGIQQNLPTDQVTVYPNYEACYGTRPPFCETDGPLNESHSHTMTYYDAGFHRVYNDIQVGGCYPKHTWQYATCGALVNRMDVPSEKLVTRPARYTPRPTIYSYWKLFYAFVGIPMFFPNVFSPLISL